MHATESALSRPDLAGELESVRAELECLGDFCKPLDPMSRAASTIGILRDGLAEAERRLAALVRDLAERGI